MTERKMCEFNGFIEGIYEDWVPIDPQPCCANCRYQEDDKICWRKEIVAYDDFYCSDWELKE